MKLTDHSKASFVISMTTSPRTFLYAKRISAELIRKTIGLDALLRKGSKVAELNEDDVRDGALFLQDSLRDQI